MSPIGRIAVAGLAKPVSRVALGFEDFATLGAAAPLLDAFYEKGGSAFDTAWLYRSGDTEKILGQWLKGNGVRDDVVIVGKGAHTPHCFPDRIGRQLEQTLDRLRTDHVDVYFMHRDNPDVPVDEFVDAMDAEVRAGFVRGPFGGSNWTRERMDAAVGYARRAGRQAPAVLSNNFSLARMLDPIWPGCVSASDDEWREWLTERQVTNFAWSSQGRGFFTDRAGRDRRDDAELVRVWYSEENFARRDRAIDLARRYGCGPIHIALAWVLAQPFPVLPLIGPRTIAELDDSLEALGIELTADETEWLASGD
jgi:aryl-alcohol dehydrogenase-like predicted oxidoreductase